MADDAELQIVPWIEPAELQIVPWIAPDPELLALPNLERLQAPPGPVADLTISTCGVSGENKDFKCMIYDNRTTSFGFLFDLKDWHQKIMPARYNLEIKAKAIAQIGCLLFPCGP